MNYLVTGGAGFMGINLVRFLLARGHKVRSYDIAPFDYPEADQISIIHGDIRNRDLHARAFDGIDVVVHCAAALPLCSREEIFSTDVEGTRRLLTSATTAGIERFINISSTSVYGVSDHHPLCEDDKLVGVGPYGEAKIQGEAVCAEFRKQGQCIPVLRPKSFIGPERLGAFELLYDLAFQGHNFPVLGTGNNAYQLLDVEDLCQAVYLCATGDRSSVNDVFNVGAARFGSLGEGFQAVLERAGHGKRVVRLPAAPAIATLRLLELLHLSPLYQWIYETAAKESFVSIEKIVNRLGFVPKYSNEEALIRNFDWYKVNRDRISGRVGVTHRQPWKRGVLKFARFIF